MPGGSRPNSGPRPVVFTKTAGHVPTSVPPPPVWLPPPAKAHYRKVGRQLVDVGVLTVLDGTVLSQHAASWWRWQEAERHLLANGAVVPGQNGVAMPSPWVKIGRDAYVEVLRTAVELGLTPSARGRVKTPDVTPAAALSPIGRLLASRGKTATEWWEADSQ